MNTESQEFISLIRGLPSVDTNNLNSELGNNPDKFFDMVEKKCGFPIKNRAVLSEIVQDSTGKLCTLSIAGSGKTVALLNRLGYRIKTKEIYPHKTVCVSFLSSDAGKLEADFKTICGAVNIAESEYGAVRFGTLHSIFLEILRTAGVNWKVIGEKERLILVKRAAGNLVKTSEEVSDLNGAISYVDNSLEPLDVALAKLSVKLDMMPLDLVEIYQKFKQLKNESKVIDFDDMQTLLLSGLRKNENLAKYVGELYHNIYIDEFQDISNIQYEILKYMFVGSNKDIFLIGDDDQSMYSWRGASPDIITKKIAEDFNFTFKYLEHNYRSGNKIVDFVKTSIIKNENRFKKEIAADRVGGSIKIIYGTDTEDTEAGSDMVLAENIIDHIKHWENKEIYNTAILVRENKHSLPITIGLIKNNIEFVLTNDMQTLKSNKLVVNSLDLIKLCANMKKITECGAVIKTIIGSKAQQLRFVSEYLLDISRRDISFSAPKLLNFYDAGEKFGKKERTVKDMAEFVLDVVISYALVVGTYNKSFSKYLLTLACMFEYIINTYCRSGNISEFMSVVDMIDDELIRRKSAKKGILVSTVHNAKGKGWNNVIIFNDSEGYFPANDQLTSVEIEEERRVHYVAVTRAKNNLIIGVKDRYGYFLTECDFSQVDGKEEVTEPSEEYFILGDIETNSGIDFKKHLKKNTSTDSNTLTCENLDIDLE